LSNFQSPNQDPGNERRLLLTFALTFVVIFITQQFIAHRSKPTSPEQPKAAQTQAASEQPSPTVAQAAVSNPPPVRAAVSEGTKQATSESQTVIENDLYRITFSNRGGLATSWVLKKYDDDKHHPLELVNPIAGPRYGYPLSLFTYDEGLRSKLNQALYVGTQTGSGTNKTLAFEYSDGNVSVRKTFTFSDSYEVHAETTVTQGGAPVSAYPMWPAGFGDETVASSYAAGRVDYDYNDKVERIAVKKVSNGATINGPFNWAGTADQYFAAVFLPDDPDHTALVTLHNEIQIPKNLDKPDPREHDTVPVLGAAVGTPNGTSSERIFVGPKALDVISNIRSYDVRASAGTEPNGPSLEKLVDFGTFAFFAKPLFLWLRWTQEHWVRNFGWAILILTAIINVALLPLRITTIKSAMKMQKIQPQVTAINERYKKYKLTDPKQAEKNREIQDLYKKEGVNPLGGCLPNLLQLPFLWAFYTMLGSAIELRHASWFWIHDLSSADPTHVISVLFIGSMFLMQRITPQAGVDPAQQKMMQFTMPILLGVFTWNLSAGLGLYWAAGNIIGIVQQLAFNRTTFGREMRAAIQKRQAKRR
jgi:YidC/Oxa1 family membrane protein insertase